MIGASSDDVKANPENSAETPLLRLENEQQIYDEFVEDTSSALVSAPLDDLAMYDTFEIDPIQQSHSPVVYDEFGTYVNQQLPNSEVQNSSSGHPSLPENSTYLPVATMSVRPSMLSMNSTTLLFQEESPSSSPPPIHSPPISTTCVPFAQSTVPIIDMTSKIRGLDDDEANIDPDSFAFGRKSAIESMIELNINLPSRVYMKYDEESCPSSWESSEDEEVTFSMQETPKRKFASLANTHNTLPLVVNQQNTSMNPDLLVPGPLSPDALTAFSNSDPNATERNKEVTRATERLIYEIVPLVAQKLSQLTPSDISSLNFSIYLHSHGVNIRHMGLIRSLIPRSHITNPIRTALLLQLICRTLKNITRDYQRRWMKSEQSTSEQGMYLLLIQILNLIFGSHANSEKFWTERVIVGIIQRYGGCAIDSNIDELQRVRKLPQFLKVGYAPLISCLIAVQALLKTYCEMTGLVLKDKITKQFQEEKSPYEVK